MELLNCFEYIILESYTIISSFSIVFKFHNSLFLEQKLATSFRIVSEGTYPLKIFNFTLLEVLSLTRIFQEFLSE